MSVSRSIAGGPGRTTPSGSRNHSRDRNPSHDRDRNRSYDRNRSRENSRGRDAPRQPPAGKPPTPQPRELSMEEIEKKSKALLEEYLQVHDLKVQSAILLSPYKR